MRLRKRIHVLRAEAAEALLVWYETTHGNTIGEHDHHCGFPDRTRACSCGWAAAEAALGRLYEAEGKEPAL